MHMQPYHSGSGVQGLLHSGSITLVFSGRRSCCLPLRADFECSHHGTVHIVQTFELVPVIILKLMSRHAEVGLNKESGLLAGQHEVCRCLVSECSRLNRTTAMEYVAPTAKVRVAADVPVRCAAVKLLERCSRIACMRQSPIAPHAATLNANLLRQFLLASEGGSRSLHHCCTG